MLCLTRKKDESIKIGDGIEVTIVEVRGEKVRLAITAPQDVKVHRKEVYERINQIPGHHFNGDESIDY